MCGIVGYSLRHRHEQSVQRLLAALQSMAHRGPDDEGAMVFSSSSRQWRNILTSHSAAGAPVVDADDHSSRFAHDTAFGHRRFSIVDLSPGGHQPMWTADRRYCVALNGELYNYVELRDELIELGHTFRTTSDTEVFAAGFQQWGNGSFQRFNGFWAASILDSETSEVLLVRDRLGKAPLYFATLGSGVYWASEIQALRIAVGPQHEFPVREQSIADFVAWHRRDYGHTTFFEGINTLPSATHVTVRNGRMSTPVAYWELPADRLSVDDISIPEAATELRRLLDDAVRLRLRADVPAAVQLSGGLDSSTALALATNHAPRVSAFTVTWPGTPEDEEPYARAVAEHYAGQVDYHVFEPPDDDLIGSADHFLGHMGEPVHSPNLFTAHKIWQIITDEGFKVNLFGSGGDEVLAGYTGEYFYPFIRYLVRTGKPLTAMTELAALSERSSGPLGIDLAVRAARAIPGTQQLYRRARAPIRRANDPYIPPDGIRGRFGPPEKLEERMKALLQTDLLNYWLRIDNQSSLLVPIELRTPFLDYRVVDLAFSLPPEYLIRDGWMKYLLRVAMNDDLPASVNWRRRKMGFPFPLKEWLIRHEASLVNMLDPLDCPYVDLQTLRREWSRLANKDPSRMWSVLSLALWWKKSIQGEALVACA